MSFPSGTDAVSGGRPGGPCWKCPEALSVREKLWMRALALLLSSPFSYSGYTIREVPSAASDLPASPLTMANTAIQLSGGAPGKSVTLTLNPNPSEHFQIKIKSSVDPLKSNGSGLCRRRSGMACEDHRRGLKSVQVHFDHFCDLPRVASGQDPRDGDGMFSGENEHAAITLQQVGMGQRQR